MDQQEASQPNQVQNIQPTSETLSMTLELIADEQNGDPALAMAVGRDTVESLQRDGYVIQPVYKGQMGGIFVEMVTTITQMATMAWDNRAIADEAIANMSGLVTIFGAILPALKKMLYAHEQRVGKE